MSRKIIGITVGTPLSIQAIKDKLNPVISINGVEADENGNAEIETGGVTSWNELTDKPDIPTKVSELQNDAGYAKTSDIPTIPTKVSELQNDAGYAKTSDIPTVPTKVSELQNDVGYAKTSDIPEIPDAVLTVNGISPDENGNVDVEAGGGSGSPENAVLYTPQVLTQPQQAQARTNIGAVSMEEVEELLGIEEEFSETGDPLILNLEEEKEIEVISKFSRQDGAHYYDSTKLTLRQACGSAVVDFASMFGEPGTVIESNGLTMTINADATATVTGTSTASVQFSAKLTSDRVFFPAGTYSLSNRYMIGCFTPDVVNLGNKFGPRFTVNEPFFAMYARIIYSSGVTVNETIPLNMFWGSTIPDGDLLYHGTSHYVDFGKAVVEGTYNWTTGELKDTDGNTVSYHAKQQIIGTEGTNIFWTGFGEVTANNKSDKDLDRVVILLGESAPEETVPSICDFTLTPTTKNYSINLAGDSRNFFRPNGNMFYGMEVPLITTRGKFVVTDSEGVHKDDLQVPELINYKGIADTMTYNNVVKRWSERFYITRDPDFTELVDDGSGTTTTNPNTIATWIFTKKEFENFGLPAAMTDIPIVSPVFANTAMDKLTSTKLNYGTSWCGSFSYDATNDHYIFKCRARQFYPEAVYKWTNGYFCYPLQDAVYTDDNMFSLYLSAGYSVRFERDDAFDVFWNYTLTQNACPFHNESLSALWNSNTKPVDAESAEQFIDVTPNVGFFVPRSVEDALYEAEHIAKRLNKKNEQTDDYESNSYRWLGDGDGKTDYTEKIQSKLTEIHNTSNGGTVYLGPGTYPISGSLIVYSNTRIIGFGIQTVIKQTADNTDAIVLNGSDITLEDFSINLAGACTELTACVYANSNNSVGDDGYPSNFYVTNLTMNNILMSGNYKIEYADGKPVLGDVYNNYMGVGIRSAPLYFNYAHIDNVHGKYLMATIHNGGGGNYFNITAEFCKYAVYTGGVNCQYFINGHSYYAGNKNTDDYISMSDYVVYEDCGHNNKYSVNLYDCHHFKYYFYFGGESQSNSYTLNANRGSTHFGLSVHDELNQEGQIKNHVIDFGRGNVQIARQQDISFAIGNTTKQISSLPSFAFSDPTIRNALSGAGIWGNISSNVVFNNYGIDLIDVCRYPSERVGRVSYNNVASIVSSTAASNDSPIEIEIDISNRPIYGQAGFFIQFDHRYVASDFIASYDTTGDGLYDLSYEIADNTNVTTYMTRIQDSPYLIHRIKLTFTKPLQIENFTYQDSGFRSHTIDYNPDGLIGICNIGMTVNDYAGRSFLGECGGSLYGNVDMHQNTLKNLPDPVDAGDAVSKSYLEAKIAELMAIINGT